MEEFWKKVTFYFNIFIWKQHHLWPLLIFSSKYLIFSYENRATYEHFWCFEILKLQRKFHFKIHLSRWNSTNEISLCNVNSTYSFRFYLGVPFQSLAWWDFEFGDTILLTSKFLYNVVFSKGSILLRKSA